MAIHVQIRKRLDNFSLDIAFTSESRRIGILGASGSGKSITLKSIAGIEVPDEGKIEVEGHTFFDKENGVNLRPQNRKVGYLFQNYALFPTMSVEKNIGAGLKGRRGENEQRIQEMIDKFHLRGLEKRLPCQLSGGQQQRVALARIMAYEPEVILLDEPFSALDMYLRDQLQQELVGMLEDYAGTVIMVSHNRDEVYRFSEELIVIDRGKVAVAGRTKVLFENPVSREAARLTGCKNFSRAERIDDHTVKMKDWGITIHVKEKIPFYTKWIGYRAHDFVPVWGEQGENMLKVYPESSADLPFERNYYLRVGTDGKTPDVHGKEEDKFPGICWFVQREKIELLEKMGFPDYLEIREEKILFLR